MSTANATLVLLGDIDRSLNIPLNFASRVFVARIDSGGQMQFHELYRVKPQLPLKVSPCPQGFDPSHSVWDHRRNLWGAELKFVFDEWSPFSQVIQEGTQREDWRPRGVFRDMVDSLAQRLNFTPKSSLKVIEKHTSSIFYT